MSYPFRHNKALIVSEDPQIGRLMKMALDTIGIEDVLSAGSEEEAMARMDNDAPKFVILCVDIRGPKGLELAKRINKKRIKANRRTPKILAIGRPDEETVLQAKDAGFWDVIALPATLTSIKVRLDTVFTRPE